MGRMVPNVTLLRARVIKAPAWQIMRNFPGAAFVRAPGFLLAALISPASSR